MEMKRETEIKEEIKCETEDQASARSRRSRRIQQDVNTLLLALLYWKIIYFNISSSI
jgi:hypothetical protein